MGRKFILSGLFICLLFCSTTYATQYAYQINFTDKNGTIFSFSHPSDYLSARSILRRTNQGIPIDSTDLPVNANYIDSVLSLTGGTLHEVSKWQNLCVILDTDTVSIHALYGKSFIKSIKPVGVYSPNLHHKGNRKYHSATPYSGSCVRTTSDTGYYTYTWGQTQLVNGNYLHDHGYNGVGKLIAVLDAGFWKVDTLPGFDSMRWSGRLIDKHNFSYDTSYIDSFDTHGTSVLSTMAGYAPNSFVGTAPLAMYALYVTEIDPTEQPMELINLLCGTERADSVGADIITCSLGYNLFDNPVYNFNFYPDFDGKTTIAAKAANMATSKGILFVASAGNEGGDSWNMILTPGDADSALTIGSVYSNGVMAPNSGYGPNAAGQIKPDVCAQGQPSIVMDTTGGYVAEAGTSFATPQIAGWAACLMQAKPTATPYLIRTAIKQCASKYASPTNHYGYGIADFQCAANFLNIKDTPPVNNNSWVAVLPNPFVSDLLIQVNLATPQDISFSVTDITGRTVLNFFGSYTLGSNQLDVNTAFLPSGMYFLKAVCPSFQKVIKVVKL